MNAHVLSSITQHCILIRLDVLCTWMYSFQKHVILTFKTYKFISFGNGKFSIEIHIDFSWPSPNNITNMFTRFHPKCVLLKRLFFITSFFKIITTWKENEKHPSFQMWFFKIKNFDFTSLTLNQFLYEQYLCILQDTKLSHPSPTHLENSQVDPLPRLVEPEME